MKTILLTNMFKILHYNENVTQRNMEYNIMEQRR